MKTFFATLLLGAAGAAAAQIPPVTVSAAWARPSVQGQLGSGAFMTLTATEPVSLVGIASPAAGVAEVHEMKMEGDIMKMRPLRSLELPAGKAVELKPGGHHLMLLDLKAPLVVNSTVPVTLTFRNARGQESRVELQVPVSWGAPAVSPGAPAASHKR